MGKNIPNETRRPREDWTVIGAERPTGPNNTKGKKCANSGKLGHYAKCSRSGRKINHIADEEAYSADEDEWTPDKIHSIQQKINSLGNGSKNGPPF